MCRTLCHACYHVIINACFQTQRRGPGSTMGSQTNLFKKNDILHFNYITKCNDSFAQNS